MSRAARGCGADPIPDMTVLGGEGFDLRSSEAWKESQANADQLVGSPP